MSQNSKNNGLIAFILFFINIILSIFDKKLYMGISAYKQKQQVWKEPEITTIQYGPPIDEPISLYFFLRYNNEENPKIFTATLYYRLAKGRVTMYIKNNHFDKKGIYYVRKTEIQPEKNTLDYILLERYFGPMGSDKIGISLDKNGFMAIQSVTSTLNGYTQKYGLLEEKKMRFGVPYHILSQKGQDIINQLYGYRKYLISVDQNVIKQELKKNPNFIHDIMPRFILYGIHTEMYEEISNVINSMNYIFNKTNISLGGYS